AQEEFTVYLLNEYNMSSLYPGYLDDGLEPFKWAKNGRCYRRKNRPRIKYHGLLCCKNNK
ncbi:hypothetical protein BX070DRAFT_186492, partial [Coemansia spiralis]